ncbi:Calx-beta domain-containing protein [Bdellovibrio sp. HCB-110]|uniref:RCC1 domain-containing protein n=1 Tax=Bdellovibrio sp. HCB-110 TaxID=3391182 RepID=UPI0039B68B32
MSSHLALFFLIALSLINSGCAIDASIFGLSSTASKPTSELPLSISDKVVPEYGVATLTVTIPEAATEDVTFGYQTEDNTALAGIDYVSVSGTATIKAGETSVRISVPIMNGYEKTANKTFKVFLSSIDGNAFATASAEIEIQDDDLAALSGVVQISQGNFHICAAMNSGGVKCWGGINNNGELGNGTTTGSLLPIDVIGLADTKEISAGPNHTCALTNSGGVKCWGDNSFGQLGDGTDTTRMTPVDVGLGGGAVHVASGGLHSCALMATGTVKCWGHNSKGQLGDGTVTHSKTPVDVSGLTGAIELTAGDFYTCALTNSGGVKCWGDNFSGTLGDGTTTQKETPVDVNGLTSGVVSIAAGTYSTCALLGTGSIKCWGENFHGQLGDGTDGNNRTSPVDVVGLTESADQISAGQEYACARFISGSVKCWGKNSSGQLGDGTMEPKSTPVNVTAATGIASLSLGSSTTCAVLSDSRAKCWGVNSFGQYGNGRNSMTRTLPIDTANLPSGAKDATAGQIHNCAVTSTGGAVCWGDNPEGQLGNGTQIKSLSPVPVIGLTAGVVALEAGFYHTCAVMINGGIKCWGANWEGQLGDGTSGWGQEKSTPVDVLGVSNAVAVVGGERSTCALLSNGQVKCWGDNSEGQLGNGTFVSSPTPVDVSGLSGVVKLSMFGNSVCALLNTGGVKCWGANWGGQLGDGTTTKSSTPVSVIGLAEVNEISVGDYHGCAILESGAVKCWGSNWYGQLGDDTTTDSLTPVDAIGLPGPASKVTIGDSHTCILMKTGSVMCSGSNRFGELGNGTYVNRSKFALVNALESGVAHLITDDVRNCAILNTGGVKCWGGNLEYSADLGETANSNFVCSP